MTVSPALPFVTLNEEYSEGDAGLTEEPFFNLGEDDWVAVRLISDFGRHNLVCWKTGLSEQQTIPLNAQAFSSAPVMLSSYFLHGGLAATECRLNQMGVATRRINVATRHPDGYNKPEFIITPHPV